MSKTQAKSPDARPKRNRGLVILDLTAGSILALIGLGIGGIVVGQVSQYPVLTTACGTGPYEGLTCNAGFLSGVVVITLAITVFAWALSFGMFLVNAIRKRTAWYWPFLGLILIIAAYWVGTILASLTQAPLGAN
jgi:hypothetical protein